MKRIALWVVLVVLFVFFYNFFSAPSEPGVKREPIALGRWASYSVTLFVALFGFFLWRQMRWLKAHNEGVVLMQQGRTTDAIEKFKLSHEKSSAGLPSLNLGCAYLSLWRVPEALAAFDEYEKRSKRMQLQTPSVAPIAHASRALALAVRGDAVGARASLGRLTAASAQSVLSEVVLAARAGDWADAKTRLSQHAVLLDQLGGSQRALLDVLTSWTCAHVGGSGGAVSAVRLYRETSPDALRAAWPEVVAYVERIEAGPALPGT